MHKLDSCGNNSYRTSHRREFVRNGVLFFEDIVKCFDFAYGMSFGGKGAHRDHRSGGKVQRHLGEIFINTFQGKLAEFALYNYITLVHKIDMDPPDTEMMGLTEWDDFDMELGQCTISIKSTKKYGNLLLLETKDWDMEGRYIPNSNKGHSKYDLFILTRVDPDGEQILRQQKLLYSDDVNFDELKNLILSERWRVNITGFITNEELIDDVIGMKQILPQGATLNTYTVMDAENYYVQAGDMHEIEELMDFVMRVDNDNE